MKILNSELCGPWSVSMLSKTQLRPYYVCRQIEMTQWEQLRADNGSVARFETMGEAQRAADFANAARAPYPVNAPVAPF